MVPRRLPTNTKLGLESETDGAVPYLLSMVCSNRAMWRCRKFALAFMGLALVVGSSATQTYAAPPSSPAKPTPGAPAGPPTGGATSGGSGQIAAPPQIVIPSVFNTFYVVAQGNDPFLTMPLTYIIADRFQTAWNSLKVDYNKFPNLRTTSNKPLEKYVAGTRDPAYEAYYQSTFSLARPDGIAVIPEPTWTADNLAARCENDPSMIGGSIMTYNDATLDWYYFAWATEQTRADATYQVVLCSHLLPVLVYSVYIRPHQWTQGEFPLGPLAAIAGFVIGSGLPPATTTVTTAPKISASIGPAGNHGTVVGGQRVEYAFQPNFGAAKRTAPAPSSSPGTTTTSTSASNVPYWLLGGLSLLQAAGSVNIVGYDPPVRALHLAKRIAGDLPDVAPGFCAPWPSPSLTPMPPGYGASSYGSQIDAFWMNSSRNPNLSTDFKEISREDAYRAIVSPSPSPPPPSPSKALKTHTDTYVTGKVVKSTVSWTDIPATPKPTAKPSPTPTPLGPVARFCSTLDPGSIAKPLP